MKKLIFILCALLLAPLANAQDRNYGERLRYRNAMVKGEVLMGMTGREVKRAIGRPIEINRSSNAYGTSEQWVYEDKRGRAYFIYLDDGVVTARN